MIERRFKAGGGGVYAAAALVLRVSENPNRIFRRAVRAASRCAVWLVLGGLALGHAATPPQFLWARLAGGTDDQEARAAAADAAGNIFVTGFFTGTNFIGNTNFVSSGLEDMFLAKYDAAGNFLWARRAGGIGYDEGLGVATDQLGNVYVSGLFQNSASFGSTNLTSSGQSDAFIAKYEPNGNLAWVSKAGGSGYDEAHAIGVDAQGNAFITGLFDDNATFGGSTLSNPSGTDDIFVARCNSAGNFLWARKAGGSATNDVGNSIALDAATNVYVTGYFGGTAAFGNTNLTASGPNGLPDVFLAKYDAAGNLLWVRQAGGAGDDGGNGVAADGAGNISITGRFFGTASFGNTNIAGNGRDIFVARYSPAGDLIWARKAGGNNAIYGDAGLGIATDAGSNVFVTGYFSGNASFSTTNVASVAFDDVFCCQYDAAGNMLWLRTLGGTDLDLSYGIARDPNGNVFLVGAFASGTVAFGGMTLTNRGGRDVFLVKLGQPLVPTLKVSASNGQLVLSWPVAAADFALESANDLSATTIWTPIASGTNASGTNLVLALPIAESRKFFRLHKP